MRTGQLSGGEPSAMARRALWRAYERAPAGLDGLVHLGRRYVLPLLRWRLPVHRLSGQSPADGPPATLVTVGAAMALDALAARFFAGNPAVEPLGSVPLVRLPGVLDRLGADADLTLACVPRASARWFGGGYLHVPAFVGFRLPVGAGVEATLAGATRTVRNHARRAASAGYGWTFSRDPADLERFYRELYRPFVDARFGAGGLPRAAGAMRRDLRHGGRLIWLRHGGSTAAAALVRFDRRRLRTLAEAVHPAWWSRAQPGPQFVLKLAACDLAVQASLLEVDLGGTVPSLRDGVFRAKRAWGAVVGSWDETHQELLVRWREPGPAVRRWLHAAPLLFRAQGGLSALAAADAGRSVDLGTALELWRQLAPRGLGRLYLLGAPAWGSCGTDGRPTSAGPIWTCPAGDAAAINRAAGGAAP
jgi:hypothetical protein